MTTKVVGTLIGPTASGKTELAIELAKRVDVSLISVDSAMVYRGLDIGTAKPDQLTLTEHPHALIDVRDPEEGFSVMDFCEEADQAIHEAWEANQIPFLIGGSMMYFRAFREGLADLPSADESIRASIRKQAETEGVESVYQELLQLDPKTAQQIDPLNLRRIERSLEVFRLTGCSLVDLWQERAVKPATDRLQCELVEFIVPEIDRPELHRRIEERLRHMFESGFIKEVQALQRRENLTSSSLSMRSVGYREVWQHLENDSKGEVTQDLFQKILASTRQLARKQLTWIRQWSNLNLQPATTVSAMIEVLNAR